MADKVAKGAASSNKSVDKLGKLSKATGPVGVFFGAYSTTTNIMNAPADQKGYVIAQEAGTWVVAGKVQVGERLRVWVLRLR